MKYIFINSHGYVGYSKKDKVWIFSKMINRKSYMASFKTKEEANICKDDVFKKGIEQINKYKKERYKYNFNEVNDDME